jgi:putative FmdB family regulatory protein
MPLYQFHCKKCEKIFEIFLRPSEANQSVVCPYCRGNDVERSSDIEQDTSTPKSCGVQKDT